jgi:aminoglycoside phosphotransferase (APT) family kinase protein
VAVLLDHVDGRHPDLTQPGDIAAIADVLADQARELEPSPAGIDVPSIVEPVTRWQKRWDVLAEAPQPYLPAWAAADFDRLHARVRALPDRLTDDCLCHFDVRADNLLLRPDGSPVVLDWGLPHRGPSWTDLAFLAGQLPPEAAGDALTAWLAPSAREIAVDVLLTFAGQQAWWSRQPAPPALPTLPAFCREDAHHLFRTLQHVEGADSTP